MGWFSNGVCSSKVRLDGKTAIVTGSNTGIGKYTALDLVRRGAKVIIAVRNVEKGEAAKKEIESILEGQSNLGQAIVQKLDLSSFTSVRKFADNILATEPKLHLLINNAGLTGPREISEDGFELQFATNHLGHFLLTMLLLPRMIGSAPARIVNVSSNAHAFCKSMYFDDINMEKSYSPLAAYARTKLANVLFTKELAKRLKGTGVTVYSLHPGVVMTDIWRNTGTTMFPGALYIIKFLGFLFFKNCEQGAQTTLYCAVDESLADKSGLYYDDCREIEPSAKAKDEKLAEELWHKSIELVKLGSYDSFTSA